MRIDLVELENKLRNHFESENLARLSQRHRLVERLKAGGPGSGCRGSDCGRPKTAQYDADDAQFNALKVKWAKVNNELLRYVDRPNAKAAQAKVAELQSLVKQMHQIKVGYGGIKGFPEDTRDLVVIGAGPGGLASAIMGGTDGLDTVFIDANTKVGGQSKYSSRIENFPGFPVGITGGQLAENMYQQATRVGAEAKLGVRVTGLTYDPATGVKTVTLSNGEQLDAKAVVVAGGIEFRKMDFPGANSQDVVVGDGQKLAEMGKGKPVVVIGGSNGAAQAALGAARTASQVYLISRGPITKSMSDYQVIALQNHSKVKVIENDEVARLFTDENGHAEKLQTKNGQVIPCRGVGIFVGSAPSTDWLPSEIDKQGGKLVVDQNLETKVPGVFAVGDIRTGSIGRVGAAVGDGQIAEHSAFMYFDRHNKESKVAASGFDYDSLVDKLFDLDKEYPFLSQMADQPGAKLSAPARRELEATFEAAEEKLYEDTGKYDEAHENHLRAELERWACYAESGPTFDPAGKYLCGRCDMRKGDVDCMRVESPISLKIGSCMIYTYGATPEKDPPMPRKLTQIEAKYSERPVSKRFGCIGCEYSAEAKEKDSAGRPSWCRFWGVHIQPKACCMMNDAPDDRAPGAEE